MWCEQVSRQVQHTVQAGEIAAERAGIAARQRYAMIR